MSDEVIAFVTSAVDGRRYRYERGSTWLVWSVWEGEWKVVELHTLPPQVCLEITTCTFQGTWATVSALDAFARMTGGYIGDPPDIY